MDLFHFFNEVLKLITTGDETIWVILVFIISTWLFKEFRVYYIKKLEEKQKRNDIIIDKYSKLYTKLLTLNINNIKSEQEELNKLISDTFPYISQYYLNELIRLLELINSYSIREEDIKIISDKLKTEIILLNGSQENTNNRFNAFDSVADIFKPLKSIVVPLGFTITANFSLIYLIMIVYSISFNQTSIYEKVLIILLLFVFFLLVLLFIGIVQLLHDKSFKNNIQNWIYTVIPFMLFVINLFISNYIFQMVLYIVNILYIVIFLTVLLPRKIKINT